MTTEEIVKAAYDAGFSSGEIFQRLAAFKRLIDAAAAAEREACAKVAEDPKHGLSAWRARENIAAAIRARSKT